MKRALLPLLFLLGGCAQLPTDLPPRPSMKTPEAAATMAVLAEGVGQAARQSAARTWWQDFNRPDLDRLIETALRGQPDLAAARARLAAAERAERLAGLAADLHYSTDATLTRQRLSDNGLFPTSLVGKMYTQTDVTQSISYNLDWWGRNRALLRAAGSERQAAQDESAAVRLAIAASVADAYFAWGDVDTQLGLARELADRHRRELDLLQQRYELGLDPAQPSMDARRKLDLDEGQVAQLEYLDRSWRYRLSALIGSDPDHAGALPAPSLDASLPALPESLPLGWLAQRPDVAALRARIEAASARSDATKAEFYPNLDLRMAIGLESLDLAKLLEAGSVMGSIGPALHLPLFNSQTLQARLGQREADYAAAVAAYNKAILDAARQSADAYALAASLERRNASQQAALKETEQIHTLAVRREKLGLTGPLDALETESTLIGQRMNNIETQAARLRARVALFRAIGGDTTSKD
jgi:NodT family efflux transporter outer membrane factor (OMF) lipoprotein